MTDEIPNNVTPSPPAAPTCATCAASRLIRPDPTAIQSQRICKRLPPVPIAMPAGAGRVQILPMHPPVADGDFCTMFIPINGAN